MTGPSLRKKHSHHSIHDGIYTEARDLTQLLKKLWKENNTEQIKQVIDALIEHWETRTLAHAHSEEEGFFVELLKAKPDLEETIIKLKRDHQLINIIVDIVKRLIAENSPPEELIRYFEAMIVIFEIHNEEEEKFLFE